MTNSRGNSGPDGREHPAAGSLVLSADGDSFVGFFKGDLLEGG